MKDMFVIPRDNIISYIEYWKEGEPIPSKQYIIRNFDLIYKLDFCFLKPPLAEVIWNSCKDLLDHDKAGELLCTFSTFGEVGMVQELLDHGADIHAWDDHALRWSSANGHLEVAKLLLEHGADIHAMNDEALRCASENAHLEVIKLLLKHGYR